MHLAYTGGSVLARLAPKPYKKALASVPNLLFLYV